MLAVFAKTVEKFPEMAPTEVKLLGTVIGKAKQKIPEVFPAESTVDAIKDIVIRFKDHYPSCITIDITPCCVLASMLDRHSFLVERSLIGLKDDVICLFQGKFTNKEELQNSYDLRDVTNESLIIIDTYRKSCGGEKEKEHNAWVDAVKLFQGEFSFVVYDAKNRHFFASTDPNGTFELLWGTDSQGNIVFSTDPEFAEKGCARFYGHIPGGFFVTNGEGLRKLQNPLEQIKVNPVQSNNQGPEIPPSKKHTGS